MGLHTARSSVPNVVLLLPGFVNSKETGRTALTVICNGLNFAKANKISVLKVRN